MKKITDKQTSTKKPKYGDGLASRAKKKVSEFACHFTKKDDRDEQIIQAPIIEEQVRPIPNKSIREFDLLAKEIEKSHQIFSTLLPMSAMVLEPVQTGNILLSKVSLLSKWKYSLSLGNCETLLQKLNSFISEDTAEAMNSLKKWMDFLEGSGIKQLDSNVDRITISMQNRANYQNGYEFKDGVECFVEQHPWIYQDILICPGMLTQVQESETGENGSEVSSI